MIGEAIDHMISVFSPAVAARRNHARQVYRAGVSRAYDAARSDRMNSDWRPSNRSADLDLLGSADIIRARARSLVQNNAYAKGIIKAHVRNVVGCGIKPQSRVEGNELYNAIAERDFARWQTAADLTGRLSFYEIQRLAYAEVIEAGEALIRFVRSDNRRRIVPLALELIDADRFATDHFTRGINPATGNEVRRGVELNSDGEPVQYWLYTSHPSGVNSWRQEAKPYAAFEFVHLYKQERIGQTRGISSLAPVLWWLRNLGNYVDNELQSSAVASCLTVAVKTMAGGADGGLLPTVNADTVDSNGNTFDHIEPGMVARLMPGEDLQVVNPARSHSDSSAWLELMLRSIAVGSGLSYERLSRDYSKTNYSSNRASDLEDRREFRPDQDWLIRQLCTPVWERFLSSAVASELPGYPAPLEFLGDFATWSEHVWNPPGWEWVDPAKEQKASAEAIATNLSTLEDELGKRGKDWKDILAQRAREKQMQSELGMDEEPEPEPAEGELIDAEA